MCEIIVQCYATLSQRIPRAGFNFGLSTLCLLLAILLANGSPGYVQGDDVVEGVRSWDRGYTLGSESLFLSYSGNPWGNSSSVTRLQARRQASSRTPVRTKSTNESEDSKIGMMARGSSPLRRSKRDVLDLYNMIWCATGCNPLAYKGYGCYCGFLGSGVSIDGIDRCCKMHDWCYDATDCPMFLEYFVPYYWKCYRGYEPICAVQHGDWGGSGSCSQRLCECDRALAKCLRRYPCPRTKAMCTSSAWRLVQNIFMRM